MTPPGAGAYSHYVTELIRAPNSVDPFDRRKTQPATDQLQEGVQRRRPSMVTRAGSRRATSPILKSNEFVDSDEGNHLRKSPVSSVTMRWVWSPTSSFFAAAHDEGSAGSKRPRSQSLSRSVRLRPYESSYFQPPGPSAREVASMFTDCASLLPARPRQLMLEAVAAKNEETAQKSISTTCRGARNDSVGVLTTGGRCPGPDLRPGALVWTQGSVRAKSPGRERG